MINHQLKRFKVTEVSCIFHCGYNSLTYNASDNFFSSFIFVYTFLNIWKPSCPKHISNFESANICEKEKQNQLKVKLCWETTRNKLRRYITCTNADDHLYNWSSDYARKCWELSHHITSENNNYC